MTQCSRYFPSKDPDGNPIMVRCRGQFPNNVGNHVCLVCGAINLVEKQPGMGRNWSDNDRSRRHNMSRKARRERRGSYRR